MSDSQPVPTHPIAPRVKNGEKTPHIGPDLDAYKDAHTKTVGDESDDFWAKVRIVSAYNLDRIVTRWPDRAVHIALGSPIQDSESRWI